MNSAKQSVADILNEAEMEAAALRTDVRRVLDASRSLLVHRNELRQLVTEVVQARGGSRPLPADWMKRARAALEE